MNKEIKYFVFFLIFLLLASCSFDNKTGIWAEDSKKRKRISKQEQQKSKSEVINIYSSKDYFLIL